MKRHAFTLVELLVVIAIVGLLSAVAVINLNSSRAKAKVAAGQRFSTSINNAFSDQLILEWLFDAPAVGVLTSDTSGKGNNGTLANAPSVGVGHNGSGAYVLNGSSQYISNALPASTFTNTSFTWSAWVKGRTLHTGVNYMPTIGFGSGSWFRLGFHQVDGIWRFDQILDGANLNEVNCGPAPSATEWVFLTATAQYGGNVTCYQNGVAGATRPYVNNVTSTTGFSVGHAASSAWNEYIQGTVDDIRLYSSALTLSLIKSQYLAGLPAHQNITSVALNATR